MIDLVIITFHADRLNGRGWWTGKKYSTTSGLKYHFLTFVT